MLMLIKGGQVYAPASLGRQDILIAGGKILQIDMDLHLGSIPHQLIDAKDKIVVPGFIDSLVHLTGGGGEGGPTSRTPAVNLTDLTRAGITSVVGALGTDAISHSIEELLMHCKGLNQYGLSAYCYTGSYHLPAKNITGEVQRDIALIQECIGVGEVAIADSRGSQPTVQQLAELAAEARVGGMLADKSGIVSIHVGPAGDMLSSLFEVARHSDIKLSQFYPTHINRHRQLFEQGIEVVQSGGTIDLTTSSNEQSHLFGELNCSDALAEFFERTGETKSITFSSDGHASLPEFDSQGNLVSLEIGDEKSLWQQVRESIIVHQLPIEKALQVITTNPAQVLGIAKHKGTLDVQKDADICLLREDDLVLDSVIAKGKIMVNCGEVIVKGRFE